MSMGKDIFNNLTLLILGTLHMERNCLHHPLLLWQGEPVVGIPQIVNQTYYSPPHPRIAASVWKPTFPIQHGSFLD